MKKIIFLFAFLCSVSIFADEPSALELDFSVGIVVKTGPKPFPKSPEQSPEAPEATLDDNVLTFTSAHDAYTLTLVDEDGEAVYEVNVPCNVNVVVLPATIVGDFELQLDYGGNYYFYCEISL